MTKVDCLLLGRIDYLELVNFGRFSLYELRCVREALRFRPRLRRGRVCTADLLYESLVNFRYILVDRYSLPFKSTSGGRDWAIPGCAMQGFAMQGLERNQGEDTKESMQTPVL